MEPSYSFTMNRIHNHAIKETRDPIEDYFECVEFCSLENRREENDCQTICMQRHLQANYF